MKNEKLKNQKYAQIYSPDVDNNNTQPQKKPTYKSTQT